MALRLEINDTINALDSIPNSFLPIVAAATKEKIIVDAIKDFNPDTFNLLPLCSPLLKYCPCKW
jgi:hypothetical protein